MKALNTIAIMLGFKKRKTILVTDATSNYNYCIITYPKGDVGFEAVRALAQQKKIVVIAGVEDSKHERVPELQDMNIRVVSFTANEAETLTILKTVHKLILIPPKSEKRVETTLKVIDAAKKYKVKRITLVSVLGGNI
jgi:FlaA1/EpsC-like NDP-sugar epimerase